MLERDDEKLEWAKKFLGGMPARIAEELKERERQEAKTAERMKNPPTQSADQKDYAFFTLARDILDVAEQIRREQGFSEEPIMDQTFIFLFKGGQYSLTAGQLRDILAGEFYLDDLWVNFSNIAELGDRTGPDRYKVPTKMTHEFLNRLGFNRSAGNLPDDDVLLTHSSLPLQARYLFGSFEHRICGFHVSYKPIINGFAEGVYKSLRA